MTSPTGRIKDGVTYAEMELFRGYDGGDWRPGYGRRVRGSGSVIAEWLYGDNMENGSKSASVHIIYDTVDFHGPCAIAQKRCKYETLAILDILRLMILSLNNL